LALVLALFHQLAKRVLIKVQVVVTPGESLWSIAALVAGQGDIASVVADIVEVNSLKSADVAAGVKLLVPVL